MGDIDADPASPSADLIRVYDLAGRDASQVIHALQAVPEAGPTSTVSEVKKILIAPGYVFDQSGIEDISGLKFSAWAKKRTRTTFGVQLDMDHLGEFFGGGWERAGVGIWNVTVSETGEI